MQLDDFLLTATGILLAVLSLWALLWVSFTRGGEDVDSKKRAATIGLFWIYCSIAIAVVAFGLLLASKLFGCGCPASHAIPVSLLRHGCDERFTVFGLYSG